MYVTGTCIVVWFSIENWALVVEYIIATLTCIVKKSKMNSVWYVVYSILKGQIPFQTWFFLSVYWF